MKRITQKDFKNVVTSHKVQFLGSVYNKTLDEVVDIVKTQLPNIKNNYNRTAIVRSNDIVFEHVGADGESCRNHADIRKSTIYNTDNVYFVDCQSCIVVYRIEKGETK